MDFGLEDGQEVTGFFFRFEHWADPGEMQMHEQEIAGWELYQLHPIFLAKPEVPHCDLRHFSKPGNRGHFCPNCGDWMPCLSGGPCQSPTVAECFTLSCMGEPKLFAAVHGCKEE